MHYLLGLVYLSGVIDYSVVAIGPRVTTTEHKQHILYCPAIKCQGKVIYLYLNRSHTFLRIEEFIKQN